MNQETEQFIKRLKEYIPNNRVSYSEPHQSVYVYAPAGGLGIRREVYDSLDVRLLESIGMASLDDTHRLYRDDSHHVLIFAVNDGD